MILLRMSLVAAKLLIDTHAHDAANPCPLALLVRVP
jgi:hypothetical protein